MMHFVSAPIISHVFLDTFPGSDSYCLELQAVSLRICALRRFVCRSKHMRSDNGTILVGSQAELKKASSHFLNEKMIGNAVFKWDSVDLQSCWCLTVWVESEKDAEDLSVRRSFTLSLRNILMIKASSSVKLKRS